MKNHDCLRIHLTGMPHYSKELNDQMFEDFSWPYRLINRPMTHDYGWVLALIRH